LVVVGGYVVIATILFGLTLPVTNPAFGVYFFLGIVCIGVGLLKYIEKRRDSKLSKTYSG
jgi:hypothetical protein